MRYIFGVSKRKKKRRALGRLSAFKVGTEIFKFAKWALEVAALIITIKQCEG
jgi:hypothetical protein